MCQLVLLPVEESSIIPLKPFKQLFYYIFYQWCTVLPFLVLYHRTTLREKKQCILGKVILKIQGLNSSF